MQKTKQVIPPLMLSRNILSGIKLTSLAFLLLKLNDVTWLHEIYVNTVVAKDNSKNS